MDGEAAPERKVWQRSPRRRHQRGARSLCTIRRATCWIGRSACRLGRVAARSGAASL